MHNYKGNYVKSCNALNKIHNILVQPVIYIIVIKTLHAIFVVSSCSDGNTLFYSIDTSQIRSLATG